MSNSGKATKKKERNTEHERAFNEIFDKHIKEAKESTGKDVDEIKKEMKSDIQMEEETKRELEKIDEELGYQTRENLLTNVMLLRKKLDEAEERARTAEESSKLAKEHEIKIQETYDNVKYETLHLAGHKRVWPYRFEAQERALMGGMRGIAGSALLGLSDFRKDALATGLHMYYLQRKYPHAEISLSCPRLRPIVNNDKIDHMDVGERQLCQVLCAYRLFLPFAGITVSSRETKSFRDGIVKIAATKISAGVSTGIGDHESKYTGKENDNEGDEQFEIADTRSFDTMYKDMSAEGLQPVLNDYLYV